MSGEETSDEEKMQSGVASVPIVDGPTMTLTAPVDSLLDFIEVCRAVHDEGMVEFDETGMRVSMFHPSNVSGVNARFNQSGMDQYGVDGTVRIGLDFAMVQDVLESIDDEHVTLSVNENDVLEVDGASISYTGATVHIDVVDEIIEEERMETILDDADETIGFVATAEALNGAISSVSLVDDVFSLSYIPSDESFEFVGHGDSSEMIREYGKDDLHSIISADGTGPVSAKYRTQFFEDILSPIDKSTDASVKYADDFPAMVRYSIDQHLSVLMLVTPRA